LIVLSGSNRFGKKLVMENRDFKSNNGRIWAGVFLIALGFLFLLQRLGFKIPYWVFSWPMILIFIGFFLFIKHGWKTGGWIPLILIGAFFLVDLIVPAYSLRSYFLPIFLFSVGLLMIFKPKGSRLFTTHHAGRDFFRGERSWASERVPTAEMNTPDAEMRGETTLNRSLAHSQDYLDSVAVFGGVKKVFFTRDFKGGEAVTVFGGTEIDLSKADINGVVTLELTQVFGGTKLIVPNHWQVRSEVVAFLGGIEDKRYSQQNLMDPGKVLILNGTAVLGGIEIRTY
jgi:predicted membrane protein